jgi:hypothetical protein
MYEAVLSEKGREPVHNFGKVRRIVNLFLNTCAQGRATSKCPNDRDGVRTTDLRYASEGHTKGR